MNKIVDGVYAVEVPEGAAEIGFRADCLSCIMPNSKPGRFKWLTDIEEWMYQQGGEWEVVGTTKEVTEEIAAGIIAGSDFSFPYNIDAFPIDNLRSLLTSKGIDQDKNYVILKKQ